MYVEHPGNTSDLTCRPWDATTGDLLWDFERQDVPDDIREHTRFGGLETTTRNLAIYGTNYVYHTDRRRLQLRPGL